MSCRRLLPPFPPPLPYPAPLRCKAASELLGRPGGAGGAGGSGAAKAYSAAKGSQGRARTGGAFSGKGQSGGGGSQAAPRGRQIPTAKKKERKLQVRDPFTCESWPAKCVRVGPGAAGGLGPVARLPESPQGRRRFSANERKAVGLTFKAGESKSLEGSRYAASQAPRGSGAALLGREFPFSLFHLAGCDLVSTSTVARFTRGTKESFPTLPTVHCPAPPTSRRRLPLPPCLAI